MKKLLMSGVLAASSLAIAAAPSVPAAADSPGNYWCSSSSYPSHANSVWGTNWRTHRIELEPGAAKSHQIYVPGPGTKSIWPTGSSNAMNNQANGGKAWHTYWSGTSFDVYCRTPSNS